MVFVFRNKRPLDGVETDIASAAKQSGGVPTYIEDAFTSYATTTTAADLLKRREDINSLSRAEPICRISLEIRGVQARSKLPAPLDLLLTSSAVGVAESMMPSVAWSRFALSLATRPRTVTSRGRRPGAREVALIAEARSDLAAPTGDNRFADPACWGNPLLTRRMHSYRAANATVNQ